MASNKMMWLHCYNCAEQFETEVGYFYSSKQLCGSCRKPKQVADFDKLEFEIVNETSIQLEFFFEGDLITVREAK